ncbi:MAG: hypothetical protein GQ531_05775 [Sulfurovum sp.]|nr:hypothetical protein [Sulfurovum sp.]
MILFDEVSTRIRTVLSAKLKKEKVLDKDVAFALAMDPQNYAVIKRRKKIPFEAIAYFSKNNKLNMTWILFAQKPKYIS